MRQIKFHCRGWQNLGFGAVILALAMSVSGCGEAVSTGAGKVTDGGDVEVKMDKGSTRQVSDTSDVKPLNVKHMLRGYIYAGSKVKDTSALGGFGPCDNFPKKIDFEIESKKDNVYIVAQPEVATDFAGTRGMRLLLVNLSDKTAAFNACDSRLNVVQEAKDKNGNWKPIEYLPSSWCGNSYHSVLLPANEYWEFPAPRYTGEIKTKLRFKLTDQDGWTLVSNEFDGSINIEQFTEKQEYQPQGLMDPYDPVESDEQ